MQSLMLFFFFFSCLNTHFYTIFCYVFSHSFCLTPWHLSQSSLIFSDLSLLCVHSKSLTSFHCPFFYIHYTIPPLLLLCIAPSWFPFNISILISNTWTYHFCFIHFWSSFHYICCHRSNCALVNPCFCVFPEVFVIPYKVIHNFHDYATLLVFNDLYT